MRIKSLILLLFCCLAAALVVVCCIGGQDGTQDAAYASLQPVVVENEAGTDSGRLAAGVESIGASAEAAGVESIGASAETAGVESTGVSAEAVEADLDLRTQDFVHSMTLEDKVAQLFFITPEALTGYKTVTAAGPATREALERYPVGGLIYFDQNLTGVEQTSSMLKNTQDFAMSSQGLPVFLGVDEEGGRVLRIGDKGQFHVECVEAMGKLVQKKDPKVIYQAADTIGAYLSELGFNVDFAPDADVLVNPDNQVIGDRSFGKDPWTVAEMAWTFAEGLHDHHILACYKHFPGHGGTTADSHTGAAYLDRTLEELRKTELVPFKDGSERGIEFIMVSHISDLSVTEEDEAASLSETFVTDILRKELGYQGIVITDSLSMGAVSGRYTSGEAALLALRAGCDMLLMPQDFQAAYTAVLQAVKEDRILQERIEESVFRIVRAKLQWEQENDG